MSLLFHSARSNTRVEKRNRLDSETEQIMRGGGGFVVILSGTGGIR